MENIVFAFIGGGVATLICEVVLTLIRNYRLRQLFLLEILSNVKGVSAAPKEDEWVRGDTFSSFFVANSGSLVVFKAEVASTIIMFYGLIELFHPDDNEIQRIRWLDDKGYHDESQQMKDIVGADNRLHRERIRMASTKLLKARPCKLIPYLEREVANLQI